VEHCFGSLEAVVRASLVSFLLRMFGYKEILRVIVLESLTSSTCIPSLLWFIVFQVTHAIFFIAYRDHSTLTSFFQYFSLNESDN